MLFQFNSYTLENRRLNVISLNQPRGEGLSAKMATNGIQTHIYHR